MHTDDSVAAFLLHTDGNTKISNGPASRIRRWTKRRAQKILDWLILRIREQDANPELVLNILPITANRWQIVGGDRTPAISKCVLQDELPRIATTLNVVLAAAATKQHQTANS